QGRPQAPDRRGLEIHSSGKPLPLAAVRVLEHPPRQQAQRRRSVEEARAGPGRIEKRLGLNRGQTTVSRDSAVVIQARAGNRGLSPVFHHTAPRAVTGHSASTFPLRTPTNWS